MPRIAMNPNREAAFTGKLPPEIPVAAMITHLPNMATYHAHRLEIIQASLSSMKRNAGADHYLVVYDNGSLPCLREWITDVIRPDVFIATENVGKVNAMRFIYGMFSNAIVSISDDDMLFYPDWLKEQLKLFEVFPSVGTVSGCTTTRLGYNAIEATKKWAMATVECDERPINKQWDIEHVLSLGQCHTPDEAWESIKGKIGFHIQSKHASAWAGGGHCQFSAYAWRMLEFLPRKSDRLMKPLFPLIDVSVDQAGYLRLMTKERGCRHLGNVLSEADSLEIDGMGL